MTGDEEDYALRDFSGVMEIERLLEAAQKRPNPGWCEEREQADKLADEVSQRLFGITASDTRHIKNPYRSHEWNEARWEMVELPIRRGPPVDGTPAAVVSGFAEYGCDVTDANGGVLRCLPLFSRQIILAWEGVMGRLPGDGLTEEEADGIEARLRAEAAKFKHDK